MLTTLLLISTLAYAATDGTANETGSAADRASARAEDARSLGPQLDYLLHGPSVRPPAKARSSRSAASPLSACGPIIEETFDANPIAAGRLLVVGPGLDQVAWRRGELAVEYDSSRPTTRIEAPLEVVLSGDDCFRFGAVFTIDSIDGSPDDFFQIAFGLSNRATTGTNRTGTAPTFGDADVFDYVEFGYFPNVTVFGGPFLTPTVFGSAVPFGDAFANFASLFGPAADLGDNPAPLFDELPVGSRLQAEIKYEPSTGLMTASLIDVSGGRPMVVELGTTPLDLTFVNATDTFEVDALSITSYFDAADFDPSTRSLHARVRFHELFVTSCCP